MSEWLGVEVLQCCDETGEAAVHGLCTALGRRCWGPPAVQPLCIAARPTMLFQLEQRLAQDT